MDAVKESPISPKEFAHLKNIKIIKPEVKEKKENNEENITSLE